MVARGLVLVALLAAAGCSSDSASDSTTPPTASATAPSSTSASASTSTEPATSPASTVAPTSTTTGVALPDADEAISGYRKVVEKLASDDLGGRDNGSPGSLAAQDFLITQLSEFAQPLTAGATGPDAYRHVFDVGTNILGVIPGSDLADQYVIVGAHYDHLGSNCKGGSPADSICNGAGDNATGVAAALAVGQLIASDGAAPPRRSVIIALWDAEEDGLLGSNSYVADPIVPIEQTVAYVNFDIQGTNLSRAVKNVTVLIGAETGGPNLVRSASAATGASTLDTVKLSLLFGQGRSDHASFANAHVPIVYFTDATSPCYHTVDDEPSNIDYPKLKQQVATAYSLTRDLASTDAIPEFDADTPVATYDDAVAINNLLPLAQPEFTRLSDEARVAADQFVEDLGAIVDAGSDAFDDADVGVLLGGTAGILGLWTQGECEGFLDAPTG